MSAEAWGYGKSHARRGALIVGAGALGGPAAWQLAASGVERLVIVDPDAVELSNLNRQVVFETADVGAPKAERLADRIRERFGGIEVTPVRARLSAAGVTRLARDVGVVVDGTDGVESKFAVHDGALAAGRPLCHAGVLGWTAQVLTVLPGTTCLRCLFPDPPAAGDLPRCTEAGVVGAVAGVAAAVQAAEAVRILRGEWPALADALLTFEAWKGRWRRVELVRAPRCPRCSEQRRNGARAIARATETGGRGE